MEAVNVEIEREHTETKDEDLEGGWHTEASLKLLPGWTEHLSLHYMVSQFHIILNRAISNVANQRFSGALA